MTLITSRASCDANHKPADRKIGKFGKMGRPWALKMVNLGNWTENRWPTNSHLYPHILYNSHNGHLHPHHTLYTAYCTIPLIFNLIYVYIHVVCTCAHKFKYVVFVYNKAYLYSGGIFLCILSVSTMGGGTKLCSRV